MSVVEVDPDGPELVAWHAVHVAALRHDRPDDVAPSLPEVRAAARAGRPERDPTELVRLLLVRDDAGAPVGAGRIELPLADNLDLAYAELHVDPAQRRRRAGTALLEEVLRQVGQAGRSVLTSDLDEPAALVDASPGRAFLRAHGFHEALREVRRELALPVEAARLDALQAHARERAQGYEVVVWRDRCPDDLVEGRAELGRVMSVDSPMGTTSWAEERWGAWRVREREQLLAEQGRSLLVAAARHPLDGLVGFTEILVRPSAPEQATQEETLVLAAHRGHRLGLLLKTALLRVLVQDVPQARSIWTVNAETNAPMIAVNVALGFVPDGLSSSWERPVRR